MMAQSVMMFSLFYIMSIMMTLSSNDWVLIWVGLEINMMSFIALMFIRSSKGVEACMKYFFIQSLGSGILMMMFYSEFFWFDYVVLAVLSYKIGGGPFFFWFPSLCESLEWGSCFLLMTIQKILPLLLISFLVSMFLWIIILISIVVGALGSMNQKSMKRLMAYSSIHHIGWILMSNFIGNMMWLVYLIMYIMLISGVMLILMKDNVLDVGSLYKISSKWSFVLGMLSMGGMPPLLGFYLKWWMFYYLMMWDFSLLFFMVVMSVLMFYVYFRIVYGLVMGGTSMMSWEVKNNNENILGLDMMYLMGLNLGIILWVFLV
uniref:NADH-ubiquinone oxidoreductase chain 2 n=1 Tax=Neoscona theisi TaxID=1112448 RepID=A0A0B5CPR1_9ARAC|nr:NADH dehydrogenase subunit 2 [Neoscona theisi]AJE26543.1 NADH dehydrogenase subunit 2 [Neoscona theisi]